MAKVNRMENSVCNKFVIFRLNSLLHCNIRKGIIVGIVEKVGG